MDKWALITGASRGIGSELAKSLARRGYHLLLAGRDEAALAQVAAEIQKSFGVSTLTFSADLSVDSELQRLKSFLDSLPHSFEVLVNNAGFGFLGEFLQQDKNSISQMMNLNMRAVTELSQYFFNHFSQSKRGFILNVASTAAFQPVPFFSLYAATKAFVLSLSESLHVEGKKRGITVTVLCPGPVKTDFHQRAGTDKSKFIARFMQSASEVSEAGISGLFSGVPIVIPGLMNKVLVFSLRFVPRKMIAGISEKLMRENT